MRRLVLVRHGESVWNAEARIQGQACAGLSDLGHEQADRLAAALVEAHPEARLVVSDLRRCGETILPLARALDREPQTDVGLRERSFGAWEGRLRTEVEAQDSERWARFAAGEDVVVEVGGESEQQLADRVEPVLRRLLDLTPEGATTIAVTHGGPIWVGTHRLLGLAAPALGAPRNTSITAFLGVNDRRVLLDRYNDVGHLPAHLQTAMGRTAPGARASR